MFTTRYKTISRNFTIAKYSAIGVALLAGVLSAVSLAGFTTFPVVVACFIIYFIAITYMMFAFDTFYRDYSLYLAGLGIIMDKKTVSKFVRSSMVAAASTGGEQVVLDLMKRDDLDGSIFVTADAGQSILNPESDKFRTLVFTPHQ